MAQEIEKNHKILIKRLHKIANFKFTDIYFKISGFSILHQFYIVLILQLLKSIAIQNFKSLILKLFKFLPLNKKKIFFTSHYGDFSDNSKYLYLKMKEDPNYLDYTFKFAVKNKDLLLNKDMIDYNNKFLFYYHLLTSSEVYFNTWVSFPKRKGQTWIQLWHGFPYKKIFKDINTFYLTNDIDEISTKNSNVKKWDIIYSLNEDNTNIFKKLFSQATIIEKPYEKIEWLIT